jgi:glycosyltransferase involved in cell wall biosynthesis
MKILLVHDYGVVAGGAERITVDLRDGLRARGHDARMFASTARPLPLKNEADFTCFGTSGWPRRLLQAANPWAVRSLSQVLADFTPDVVHVRMFLTQLSPRILPLLAEVPALLHVGNHQTICPINTRVLPNESPCACRAGTACYREGCVSPLGLARTLLQLGAWRRHRGVFQLIVANSHALAAALRANDVSVGAVIPNGTRIVPPRRPLDDPPTIAFAGRLVAQKGLELLLRAMAIVVGHVPQAHLIVAGDGPDRRRIEGLVAEMSLGAHVTFCGHVKHASLAERLTGAWVQVVPSRSPEPGANVIPEAMMRGTAVVATTFGGAPEGLRDGVTGFLVPPFNPAALADRLLEILRSRALAERMGRAGRDVALAELTTERMLDRFESVYARIVHRYRVTDGVRRAAPGSLASPGGS